MLVTRSFRAELPCFLTLALCALVPENASADVFTVGDGGDYPTISAALGAVGVTGDHEVRVRAGTYIETLNISRPLGERFQLTGGWDADFLVRDPDPRSTVVDAQRLNRVLLLDISSGKTSVRGFTFRGGASSSNGAGAFIILSGSAELALADCLILDNRISADLAQGAGLMLNASGDAVFLVAGLRIEDNVSHSTLNARSAGLEVFAHGRATGEVLDTALRRNRLDGVPISAQAAYLIAADEARLTVRGLRAVDNGGPGATVEQVHVGNFDDATLGFSDSVVAADNGIGVIAIALGGELALANLTIADHPLEGLVTSIQGSPALLDVANSLLFGNGRPAIFVSGVTRENNLEGVDPRFADAAARDYRLLAGSPAIDAGTNDPAAGLGTLDAAGNPRVFGPTVDVGAYEQGPSECAASATALCLAQDRFQVDVTWRRQDGTLAEGRVVELTDDSGYLWFFEPSNVEMLVKALDACVVNDRLWFFGGGLTDVEISTRVTDTLTGDIRAYRNPAGTAYVPVLDTDAFANCGVAAGVDHEAGRVARSPRAITKRRTGSDAAAAAGGACVESETTLCLGGGRFAVTASWRSDNAQGEGRQGVLTADTGTFWFFSANNLEVVLKVLDACSINQHRWVYAAGLTNVEVVLTVTDTVSGETVTYTSPLGQSFQTITDVEALPCS